ncbi:hypothetical protein FQZ97_868420 [compost metagenome]
MKRGCYLQDEVAEFTEWLAERLCGLPINFSLSGHDKQYRTLYEALRAYSWPLKTVAGRPNPDNGYPYVHPVVAPLPPKSTLATNTGVLDVIQRALRSAYKGGPSQSNELTGAVAAILHWGGVYTTTKHGGNKPWLATNHPHLLSILQAVVNDHARNDDCSKVPNLRFNSGMTKVYSLLIDNFIIYDSRVAASLAWLALSWWTSVKGQPKGKLPPHLRFGCLAGNGKTFGYRNPDKAVFKTLSAHPHEHYAWNVRANWLLDSAQELAGEESQFGSLREIEAALFQMGERVVGRSACSTID